MNSAMVDQLLESLRTVGVDHDEVGHTLEVDAVAAFDDTRTLLGTHLTGALRAARPDDIRS